MNQSLKYCEPLYLEFDNNRLLVPGDGKDSQTSKSRIIDNEVLPSHLGLLQFGKLLQDLYMRQNSKYDQIANLIERYLGNAMLILPSKGHEGQTVRYRDVVHIRAANGWFLSVLAEDPSHPIVFRKGPLDEYSYCEFEIIGPLGEIGPVKAKDVLILKPVRFDACLSYISKEKNYYARLMSLATSIATNTVVRFSRPFYFSLEHPLISPDIFTHSPIDLTTHLTSDSTCAASSGTLRGFVDSVICNQNPAVQDIEAIMVGDCLANLMGIPGEVFKLRATLGPIGQMVFEPIIKAGSVNEIVDFDNENHSRVADSLLIRMVNVRLPRGTVTKLFSYVSRAYAIRYNSVSLLNSYGPIVTMVARHIITQHDKLFSDLDTTLLKFSSVEEPITLQLLLNILNGHNTLLNYCESLLKIAFESVYENLTVTEHAKVTLRLARDGQDENSFSFSNPPACIDDEHGDDHNGGHGNSQQNEHDNDNDNEQEDSKVLKDIGASIAGSEAVMYSDSERVFDANTSNFGITTGQFTNSLDPHQNSYTNGTSKRKFQRLAPFDGEPDREHDGDSDGIISDIDTENLSPLKSVGSGRASGVVRRIEELFQECHKRQKPSVSIQLMERLCEFQPQPVFINEYVSLKVQIQTIVNKFMQQLLIAGTISSSSTDLWFVDNVLHERVTAKYSNLIFFDRFIYRPMNVPLYFRNVGYVFYTVVNVGHAIRKVGARGVTLSQRRAGLVESSTAIIQTLNAVENSFQRLFHHHFNDTSRPSLTANENHINAQLVTLARAWQTTMYAEIIAPSLARLHDIQRLSLGKTGAINADLIDLLAESKTIYGSVAAPVKNMRLRTLNASLLDRIRSYTNDQFVHQFKSELRFCKLPLYRVLEIVKTIHGFHNEKSIVGKDIPPLAYIDWVLAMDGFYSPYDSFASSPSKLLYEIDRLKHGLGFPKGVFIDPPQPNHDVQSNIFVTLPGSNRYYTGSVALGTAKYTSELDGHSLIDKLLIPPVLELGYSFISRFQLLLSLLVEDLHRIWQALNSCIVSELVDTELYQELLSSRIAMGGFITRLQRYVSYEVIEMNLCLFWKKFDLNATGLCPSLALRHQAVLCSELASTRRNSLLGSDLTSGNIKSYDSYLAYHTMLIQDMLNLLLVGDDNSIRTLFVMLRSIRTYCRFTLELLSKIDETISSHEFTHDNTNLEEAERQFAELSDKLTLVVNSEENGAAVHENHMLFITLLNSLIATCKETECGRQLLHGIDE